MILRDIALTLEQIDHLRHTHRSLRLRLLRQECRIDTRIMNLQARYPPEVSKDPVLQRVLEERLTRIDMRRERLITDELAQSRQLHDRLLTLLHRHAQVVM